MHALLDAGLLSRVARRMTREQWESLAHEALPSINIASFSEAITPTPRVVRDAMRLMQASRLLPVLMAWQSGSDKTITRAMAVITMLDAEPALLRTTHAPALLDLVANAIASMPSEPLHDLSEAHADEFNSSGDASPDLRQFAMTRFGGLLYLLGVIEDLHLPDEMLEQFAARGLRWGLHQLAMVLLTIEADDPAALALAGLQPDATPPHHAQESITQDEARAMQTIVARLLTRLRALLDWQTNDASLLAFVCERRAEIIADPGWIEVRFSHDTVATELRRAGLDLDPGYVDWLGVVVKFVYA
jgi:hypothetical protein